MFKMGLLTSTAMTAVTLLWSGAGAYAQTGMHVASGDSNTRFLCTYGQFLVSASVNNFSYYSTFHSQWQHVAVPVTGHGHTVSRIRVMEAQASRTSNSAFTAGVYSNTPSGLPGNAIAVGSGKAGSTCGPVIISIPPTTLKPHTTYWIEEATSTTRCHSAMRGGSDANRRKFRPSDCVSHVELYWEADPKTKRKAYVQNHYLNSSSNVFVSSSTSPWTKQSTGPYVRLK